MFELNRVFTFAIASLSLTVAACTSPVEGGDDESDDPVGTDQSALVAQKCDDGSIWMSHSLPCVEWTGGWPSGNVRASAGIDYYSIKLQTCSAPGTKICQNYIDVPGAVVVGKPRTGWYKVSKYGMYRTCVKVVQGSSWACMRNYYTPYLGD